MAAKSDGSILQAHDTPRMAASAACGFVRSSSASAASAIAARSTEQPKPRWRAKRDGHKARSALERAPKDKSTVEGFLNRWLDAKAAECGVATLHAYKWAITQHVIPYIGERRICDLDPLDIDELLSALRKPWGERKTACSTRTIRAVFVTLRAAFNYAVQRRLIPITPLHGHKTPKHRVARRPEIY